MKIWYQTASSYRYDPTFDTYGQVLYEQCKRAARPDTEIYVTGVPKMIIEIDRFKTPMYYHTSQMLNNMLRAEREGFDAFVSGCSFDPGFLEGREMLDIPVVSIGHMNLHMASMLGERFAILTCLPWIAERYRQLVRGYALQEKFLPGPYFHHMLEVEVAQALNTDPVGVAKKFKTVAERAIADGASVLIPVPAFISQLFYKTEGLTNLQGATILDPVAVAIKMGEMLVDLRKIGIEVSRTFQVGASPDKELLKKIFETYAPVFNIQQEGKK